MACLDRAEPACPVCRAMSRARSALGRGGGSGCVTTGRLRVRLRACDGRFFQLSIRSLRWPSWNRRVLRSQAGAERRGQQWPALPADENDLHGRKADNEKEQGIENAMEAAPTAHQVRPARIYPATARRMVRSIYWIRRRWRGSIGRREGHSASDPSQRLRGATSRLLLSRGHCRG